LVLFTSSQLRASACGVRRDIAIVVLTPVRDVFFLVVVVVVVAALAFRLMVFTLAFGEDLADVRKK
jgi:hypothetical protein